LRRLRHTGQRSQPAGLMAPASPRTAYTSNSHSSPRPLCDEGMREPPSLLPSPTRPQESAPAPSPLLHPTTVPPEEPQPPPAALRETDLRGIPRPSWKPSTISPCRFAIDFLPASCDPSHLQKRTSADTN
jgi:hypothetical protein